MTYYTHVTLRRSRTQDGRPAAERIEQLEAEVAALRAEVTKLRQEKDGPKATESC